MIQPLGITLLQIENYPHRYDGEYTVFVPCDITKEQLEVNTPSMVIFSTIEQLDLSVKDANYKHPLAQQQGFCELADVYLVKEVMQAALFDKPSRTQQDAVFALIYYLEHDGFYDFTVDNSQDLE